MLLILKFFFFSLYKAMVWYGPFYDSAGIALKLYNFIGQKEEIAMPLWMQTIKFMQ